MLKTASGQTFNTEQAIFPIMAFTPETGKFHCLGTGFFITPNGGFVTARHVLFDNNNNPYGLFLGIQRLANETSVIRFVTKPLYHPHADIAIGMLAPDFDDSGKPKKIEIAPRFTLSFNKVIKQHDKVATFGYPNTLILENNPPHKVFQFQGKWSEGKIINLLDRSPLVNNRCIQTDMFFDSGTSGGPVFKDGKVIAINSSSIQVGDGEEPISFVTPIHYLMDMSVIDHGNYIPFKKLVDEKYIAAEFEGFDNI